MYIKLNDIQPRLEEWIKRSWRTGKWSPNVIVSAEGEIIDARLRGGLRPSPVTRDLRWGIPVPTTGNAANDEEMKDKVLCESFTCILNSSLTKCFRCLGMPAPY